MTQTGDAAEATPAAPRTRKTLKYVDDRMGSANFLKRSMDKVFPDHWSFMLGEIALYSFVILLLSGVYLTLFFHASQREVIYNGSYQPLRGTPMTDAYASTLHISFDVRGGLLMRQIHHWAALLFTTSIVVHMFRVFFTGAYRKPRTINWTIGCVLLILALLEGFSGYSLPDDLLSGTGLRIADSIVQAVPVVGTYVSYFLFGGSYPGTDIISRLFIIHVLLIPGILLALIGAHMMILWHQKHTDFPGPGKTEDTVVGTKFYPTFFLKTNGFLFLTFGMIVGLATFATINPVWLYGPYNPGQVSAGSQPDWYILFLDGSLRMMPNWESHIWHHTISWNLIIPGLIIPGILFTLLFAWPALEAWATKDKGYHNLLDRPRDVPVRTALGVTALTFYLLLMLGGANDILADTFHLSLEAITEVLRVLLLVLPPVMYKLTKRICLGLQHHDEALLRHGVETGMIRRTPTGGYYEVEEPLPAGKAAVLAAQIGYDLHGIKHPLALITLNGHTTNGRRPAPNGTNGHDANGHDANGHDANGHGTNGHGTNGSNGHGTNGSNGHGTNVSNGHRNGHATTVATPTITRPPALAERIRLRLEHFFEADRQTIPDAHSDENGLDH